MNTYKVKVPVSGNYLVPVRAETYEDAVDAAFRMVENNKVKIASRRYGNIVVIQK